MQKLFSKAPTANRMLPNIVFVPESRRRWQALRTTGTKMSISIDIFGNSFGVSLWTSWVNIETNLVEYNERFF